MKKWQRSLWRDSWLLFLTGIPTLAEQTLGLFTTEIAHWFAWGHTAAFVVFVHGVTSGRFSPSRTEWKLQINKPLLLRVTTSGPLVGVVLLICGLVSWQQALAFGLGFLGAFLIFALGAPLVEPVARRLLRVRLGWPLLFLFALLLPILPILLVLLL